MNSSGNPEGRSSPMTPRDGVGAGIASNRDSTAWMRWRRRVAADEAERIRQHLEQAATATLAHDWPRACAAAADALRLAPRNPECHQTHGNILLAAGDPEAARQAYETALALAPDAPALLNNLGTAWQALAEWDRAAACYNAALHVAPDLPPAHVNLGMLLLLRGEYEAGWPHYDWRLRMHSPAEPPAEPPSRDRLATPCRVVLDAEQGLGDTLQMARFARTLSARGHHVVMRVPARLVPLLKHSRLAADVIADHMPCPPGDTHIPLMSIPGRLGVSPDTIPCPIPYLVPEPARIVRWRGELAPLTGLRIAIVWQGNPQAPGDAGRSIPLAAFAPLARPGVCLIALQRGYGNAQLTASPAATTPVVTLGPDLDTDGAFLDTAAILRSVDLVIACDTAVAHLAGAMGVPVWLALCTSPHWTWMLDRTDSPWYPTTRIFRQPRRGDWASVFERMALALEQTGLPPPPPHEINTPTPRPVACRLARTRHGWLHALATDRYIGRALLLHGEYSEDEAQLLCRYLSPGDVVVEVGAHIGALTLPLARRVGSTGCVHAFEPQPVLHELLRANVELNGLRNVHCLNAAAGARAGRLRLPPIDYAREGNFGGISLGRADGTTEVAVRRVDALRLKACRLIKIDVEGMECRVLQGATQTLNRHSPILYVEADRVDTLPELRRRLTAAGYRIYLHTPPIVSQPPNRDAPADELQPLVSANLLCLPPNEPEPDIRAVRRLDNRALDELEDLLSATRLVSSHPEVGISTHSHDLAAPSPPPANRSLARTCPSLPVPTPPAELLDRLTVLELKAARAANADARARAEAQRTELQALAATLPPLPPEAADALTRLRAVNAAIWDAENRVRELESRRVFDDAYVRVARSIHRLNDERARLKSTLNRVFNARFDDEKTYTITAAETRRTPT